MELVRQTLQHNRGFFTARMLVEFIKKTRPIPSPSGGLAIPSGACASSVRSGWLKKAKAGSRTCI